MDPFFFCIFCPSKEVFKRDLREHIISNHKRPVFKDPNRDSDEDVSNDNNESKDFKKMVDNLIDYCTDVEDGLRKRRVKYLPEYNVNQLLIGCSLCDQIVKHYKLKFYDKQTKPNKEVCLCNGAEEGLATIRCIECRHFFHFRCLEPKPTEGFYLLLKIVSN